MKNLPVKEEGYEFKDILKISEEYLNTECFNICMIHGFFGDWGNLIEGKFVEIDEKSYYEVVTYGFMFEKDFLKVALDLFLFGFNNELEKVKENKGKFFVRAKPTIEIVGNGKLRIRARFCFDNWKLATNEKKI